MDFSCFNYVCKWMMSLFCLICMHTYVFSLFTRKQSYLLDWNAAHHIYNRIFRRWWEMHRLKWRTTAPPYRRIPMHLPKESFFHIFRIKVCASVEANGQDETRTTSRRANAIWVGVGTPQKAGAPGHYWLTRVWISNFKLFFLLNGAFNLDSVWTIISMRIFLTICDPIWLYVLLFLNFNILGVLAQHFGYTVSTYLHKMLNHTRSIVEFCILKYWNNIYYSTFTYFLLLKKKKTKNH